MTPGEEAARRAVGAEKARELRVELMRALAEEWFARHEIPVSRQLPFEKEGLWYDLPDGNTRFLPWEKVVAEVGA